MLDLEGQLDVFWGAVSDVRAHVYVRLRGPGEMLSDYRIEGEIRGPESLYAETLPATVPLVQLAPGATLLAQAVIPDPCCWSPQHPALYRVRIQVTGPDGSRHENRLLGIRAFGASGRNLILESRRWVLRGVQVDSLAQPADLGQWRAQAATRIIAHIPDETCEAAGRAGVLHVVRAAGKQPELEQQLVRFAQVPAIAIVVLDRTQVADGNALRRLAPNLLLAQQVATSDEQSVASWADLVFWRLQGGEPPPARLSASNRPVIAVRRLSRPGPLEMARAACDHLQRDLAPHGDFAGYCV